MKDKKQTIVLVIAIVCALVLFFLIFGLSQTPVQDPGSTQTDALSDWTLDNSASNGMPLSENGSVYELDTNLYDVYLTVFPTEDADGNLLTFRNFDLHQSRDHTYNPVLDCNIQILEPGEIRDPLYQSNIKNATIRVRGNSSRGDTYKNYKVRLEDDAETFKGMSVLNINKHSEDVCKVSTKLTMDLISQIPNLPGFRTYFFRVWICDASLPTDQQEYAYYGLYTDIEQPNKSYLNVRGLSENAVMYKAHNFSFRNDERLKDVDDPAYSQEAFEEVLSIREGKDHKKLLDMVAAVNDMTRDFEEIFSEYFNEDNFLTWLAFNVLIENDDIINHNYILYSPENSKTWYFIPWDVDGAMRFGEYGGSLMKLPEPLRGIQKLNQNILMYRYFRLEGSLDKLERKMEEMLSGSFSESRINSLLDRYIPVLEQTVVLEPDIGLLKMPPNELPNYLYGIHDAMEDNLEVYRESNQYPTPMYVAIPSKNADGSWHYAWDASYSYYGRPITYNIVVSDDYNMNNVIFEAKDLATPEYDSAVRLAPGTYYVKVTAVDSAGNEQLSMERYETMITDQKAMIVNGVLQFQVE